MTGPRRSDEVVFESGGEPATFPAGHFDLNRGASIAAEADFLLRNLTESPTPPGD